MTKLQKIDITALIIRAKRVKLRGIAQKDATEIFYHFDSTITRYMYPSPSKEIGETLAFINGAINEMQNKENIQLVILDIETDEFLGCCGLHKLNDPEPELGIWLKRSAQGKGLGREAITALVDWAKKNTDFETALYPVDKRNISSRKIPESLGGVVGKEFNAEGMAGNKLELVEYRVSLK